MDNKKLLLKLDIVLILTLTSVMLLKKNNNKIKVTSYDYYTDKITDNEEGYKIIQISDLHNKQFGKKNKFLLNVIKNEAPDIIVTTGDIIDNNEHKWSDLLYFFNKLTKISPVYWEIGNHENYMTKTRLKKLINELTKIGVIVIDNRYEQITENIYLIGINDNNRADYTLQNIINTLDTKSLKIALEHRPHLLKHYANQGADLVLSGHAHGGQWQIPFINQGIFAPDQGIFPKLTTGKHKCKNTTMFISRGLGGPEKPPRIFNGPEIVKIIIKKNKKQVDEKSVYKKSKML